METQHPSGGKLLNNRTQSHNDWSSETQTARRHYGNEARIEGISQGGNELDAPIKSQRRREVWRYWRSAWGGEGEKTQSRWTMRGRTTGLFNTSHRFLFCSPKQELGTLISSTGNPVKHSDPVWRQVKTLFPSKPVQSIVNQIWSKCNHVYTKPVYFIFKPV